MKNKKSFYEWCIENCKESLLQEWHPTKNGELTPQNVSASSNKKIWWIVNYHDNNTGKDFQFEWTASPNNRKRGHTCPYLCSPPKMICRGFNDLQTLYPNIAQMWHPIKNGSLKPFEVFPRSGKKVWWYLPYDDPETGKHFDFEWEASVQSMTNTPNCPYLSNNKVWKGFNDVATRFPELLQEWDSENEVSPEELVPGSTIRIKWICKKYPEHKWKTTLLSRTRLKSGCPYCAGQKVKSGYNDIATTDPELIKEWDPENKIKPTEISSGSTKKIKWICSKNVLHKYEATPNDRASGKGCPYCAGRRILQGDNDLQTLYPAVAAEWDYEKNGNLKPTMVSAHNMRKVWWICPKGHSYDMEIANKVKESIGCPICSNRRLLEGYNDLATVYPELAEEWDPANLLPANKVIAGSAMEAKWICKNNPNHKWTVKVASRAHFKTGCPFCNASRGEMLISDILTKLDVKFEREYRIKGCAIQRPLPFDFAVFKDDKLFLIEYDGIQHFVPIDIFGGEVGLSVRKRNDIYKNKYCSDHNIPLLRIPYILNTEDNLEIEEIIFDFLKYNKIPNEIISFYRINYVNYEATQNV